jgi:hypothetical protein
MLKIRHAWLAPILGVLFASTAAAQPPPQHTRFYQTFNGRFHCGGNWYDFQFGVAPVPGLLGVVDEDEGVRGSVTFYFQTSLTTSSGATFMIKGPYDQKTGAFRLNPAGWVGEHSAQFDMFGLEGKFDMASETPTAKIIANPKCDDVQIAPAHRGLPPLPSSEPPKLSGVDTSRPERTLAATNVTNWLDSQATIYDFEYVNTRSLEPPGTVHTGPPIDEVNETLKNDKWLCLGSTHVIWDATGLKGTAPDGVALTERFVMQCVGDCKDVFYRPYIGANITHFGLTSTLPILQIKNIAFGGTMQFRWNVWRKSKSSPAPEIYFHRWQPLVGFGPFDPVPAEIARRQAAMPSCKAP